MLAAVSPRGSLSGKGPGRPCRLLLGIGGVALSYVLVWLPLMYGGRHPGWLLIGQAATLAACPGLVFCGLVPWGHPRGQTAVIWALVIAVVASVVSAVWSLELGTSVPALLGWVWLTAVGLSTATLAGRRWGREALAGLLMLAAFLQAFWGFFVWWGSQDPMHQQVGTFYASNQYAGYLLLLAPLFLALSLTSKSRMMAAGAGLASAYIYLAILLSGSRGGSIAAGIGILAVGALAARRRLGRTLFRTLLMAAALVGLGMLMTSSIMFRAGRPSAGFGGVIGVKGTQTGDLTQRLHWDEGAISIGLSRPLSGTGLGTFGDVFYRIQHPAWQWSRWAHNQYLESFAEGGVLLLAAMVALPVVALVGGARALRGRSLQDDFGQLGALGGLIGGSVHLVMDHDWSYPAYAAAFVVVAVLTVAPWGRAGEDDQPVPLQVGRNRIRRSGRVAIIAASLLACALLAGQYFSGRLVLMHKPEAGRLHLALALAPYSPDPFERLGLLDAQSESRLGLLEAAGWLRGAVRRNQLEPRLRWELAGIYVKLGNVPAARAAYRSAIEIGPLNGEAYLLAAAFEADAAHDPSAGVSILDQGIKLLALVPPPSEHDAANAPLVAFRTMLTKMVGG